ncbi:uncharacterized protein LOC134529746 isoform X3 [Bacillus rossius redtenbacheri]|uniref:uncharacterized protein LOC134529746 isoform X3 n=1 Tax=Bacillus rossius redtenbacheri TaxID=93214 RepID=UPI002FDE3196
MEEKRDKRIGKSGHLWLSARRKKRKATAAIAYQQERKKKRLQEHSKIPEENTSTVINKGNEEWSAPSTSRSESGILNLITGTKILQYEENHHNSQDVDLQEVLSEKPVTQTIVRDNQFRYYTSLDAHPGKDMKMLRNYNAQLVSQHVVSPKHLRIHKSALVCRRAM